jgi:hypothetical protein
MPGGLCANESLQRLKDESKALNRERCVMPPEDKLSQVASGTALQGDAWDGPWGSISPVPHSIETLCVQIENEARKPRLYYYPYRTIGKWNWTMDVPETLEIQVGGIQIMISGIGLRRLADALNLGQLRLVQLNRPPPLIGEICIQAVSIEDAKD